MNNWLAGSGESDPAPDIPGVAGILVTELKGQIAFLSTDHSVVEKCKENGYEEHEPARGSHDGDAGEDEKQRHVDRVSGEAEWAGRYDANGWFPRLRRRVKSMHDPKCGDSQNERCKYESATDQESHADGDLEWLKGPDEAEPPSRQEARKEQKWRGSDDPGGVLVSVGHSSFETFDGPPRRHRVRVYSRGRHLGERVNPDLESLERHQDPVRC